jgi:uncharacterized C2H2 Zn-finger protein
MSEECADCGASFSSPPDLIDHMNTAHGGGDATASLAMNPMSETPLLECALCGRTFTSREALAAHNLSPHPIGAPTRRRHARAPGPAYHSA